MKKHLSRVLPVVAAILVLWGCNESKQNQLKSSDAITVITEHAKATEVYKTINLSGNIEGNKTVRLGFMVAGKIRKVLIEEGAPVKTGQLIANLEDENYSMAKEIADANLNQVQDEFDRLNKMHSNNSLSESDYSKVTNALRVAKANFNLQEKNLKDTKLFSPLNGVLLKKGAEDGEIIGQGMPVFVVSDIIKVRVSVSVPETEFNQIKINNEAEVYVSSLEQTFIGKITEIGSLAEPTTRAFTVKIDIQNNKLSIRPGMTSEVRIKTSERKSAITLPVECVLKEYDNSAFVYVVDRKKKQAFKRRISIGQVRGNRIEILSGINPEEEVVTGGQYNLVNGSSIN